MPEPIEEKKEVVEEVVVTEDNAAEVARKEFVKEKAEREGKEPPKEEETKPEEESKETPEKDTLNKDKPKGKEKEEEAKPRTDEEILAVEEKDLSKDEKARKKEIIINQEAQAKEDERILNTDDAELKEDELTRKKDLLIEEGKKLKVKEKEAKDKEQEITDYATEHNMSEEQAVEELKSIAKIEDKYGKDARKLAKANLHIQRLYTQVRQDLDSAIISRSNITIDSVISAIEDGKIKIDGKNAATSEDIIASYRHKNPDITEDLEDEKVLKLAARDIKSHLDQESKQSQAKMIGESEKKKQSLIKSLSENDKKYLPDIQDMLDELSPQQVMKADFSLRDAVLWAKGKHYEKDLQKAKEEGIEIGKRINTGKVKTGPVGGGSETVRTKTRPVMTPAEKTEAWEMFPSSKDDDECFANYIEIKSYKQSLKDKKGSK